MNSLFSLIMVIVMAFSMVGGAIPTEGPISVDAKIGMDVESLMAIAGNGTEIPAESAQAVKAIGDIVNALTVKGVASKGVAELDLFAGEDVLMSLGVKNTEEGSTFASSLLGSQVVFTSAEMVEMMKKQMMAGMAQNASGAEISAVMTQFQSLNKEQIKKDCEEWADSLKQSFEEKKGETETGEFTVDGMAFTARTPVNVTYTELMELVLIKVKELLAKESFQPLLQAYGQGTDIAAEIDKAIEQLKNQAEEEKPELQMAIYTDDAGSEYCACDMTYTPAVTEERPVREEKMYVAYGTVSGLQRSCFHFATDSQTMDMTAVAREDGSADIEATVVTDSATAEINANKDPAGNLDMVWNIKAEQANAVIHAKTEKAENKRINYTLDVYFGGTDKPLLSFTGSAGKGGEIVSIFEGDDLTVVPMEKLMDTQDTTASSQLSLSMATNLLKAVTVLTKNLPEDTADWVNAQVMQMMNPSAPEAPQGDPAVSD